MRVLLVSSHYLGVLYLEELLKAGDEVVGAVVLPGTGGWYIPPEYDFRDAAFRKYIPVYEPPAKELNSPAFLDIVEKLSPDFIVSGYYPRIFKDRLLSIPKYGCVNTHPTGLPRFRGLSPYMTHVLFGDSRNYITMHWLDPGVDTGDIIAQASVPIEPEDTGFMSGHKNTEAAARMFRETWPLIKAGKSTRTKQDPERASVFNFDWSIAEINWRKSALGIHNIIRALTKPLNGAWSTIDGRKLMIYASRVVPKQAEIKSETAVPGEILAVTGKGLWVQCLDGQLEILSHEFIGDDSRQSCTNALFPQAKHLLGSSDIDIAEKRS